MRTSHKLIAFRAAPVVSIACVLSLVLAASPALAGTRHGLAGTFGSASSTPADPEPLVSPSDVAINEATGDVYVVDKGDDRVEWFSAAGAYLGQFNGVEIDGSPAGTGKEASAKFSGPEEIAIDNDSGSPSHGDVYVTDTGNNVVDKFSAGGEYLGDLKETPEGPFGGGVAGVAVDPSGNVWVYAYSEHAAEFNDEGAYVPGSSFNTERTVSSGLAVDSRDDLYIITGFRLVRRVVPPEPSGDVVIETGSSTGVAADQSNGDVYVDQGDEIFEYGSFGEPFTAPEGPSEHLIEGFGSGQLAGGAGLAVNAGDGVVYVVDSASNDVEIYALGEAPEETPHTDAATNVEATTAIMHGELNPGGKTGQLEYQFDYNAGAGCTGGQSAPVPAGKVTEAKNAAVQADATGLQPHTLYTYCLTALNVFGSVTSAEEVSFTTAGAPPVVTAESSENVTASDATLRASINPENTETTYHFELSTNETFSGASTLGTGTLPATYEENGTGPVDIGGGLSPDTTYYYRVVASNGSTNGNGTTVGPPQSFVTAPLPPTAETGGLVGVTATTAIISGELDGMGADTHYFSAFGLTESYGSTMPAGAPSNSVDAGVISSNTPETTELTDLTPNTTYHYRLVAFNVPCISFGSFIFCTPPSNITYGQDREFTTLPLAPGVTTDPPATIGASTATLAGRVVPQGVGASYRFEYGTSTAYGTSAPAPEGAVSASTEAEDVTFDLAGLQPGVTYHYRLVSTNTGGETFGEDRTFTTNASGEPSDERLPGGFSLTQTGNPPTGPAATVFADLTPLTPTPSPPTVITTTTKTLTNAQKLKDALKVCDKDKSKTKREDCEKAAKKKYGPKAKSKGKKKSGEGSH